MLAFGPSLATTNLTWKLHLSTWELVQTVELWVIGCYSSNNWQKTNLHKWQYWHVLRSVPCNMSLQSPKVEMSNADGVGVDTQWKAWGVGREVMSFLASAITGISSRAWDPSWGKTSVLQTHRTSIFPLFVLFAFWDQKEVLSFSLWFIDFILFLPGLNLMKLACHLSHPLPSLLAKRRKPSVGGEIKIKLYFTVWKRTHLWFHH